MLFEPSVEQFEQFKGIKKLSRPDRAYLFKLERRYFLSPKNTKSNLLAALGNIKKVPLPGRYQRKLL